MLQSEANVSEVHSIQEKKKNQDAGMENKGKRVVTEASERVTSGTQKVGSS